jgi:hypothetical protein
MKKLIVLVAAVALVLPLAAVSATSKRSGVLHVTKNCKDYNGAAGDFCTITTSNLKAIKAESRVVYASAIGDPTPGFLDSDLVLDGPGNNNAYGHVVLDVSTFTGVVTFSGGTGVFRHFHAGPLAVACAAFPDCTWDGPYSFDPHG